MILIYVLAYFALEIYLLKNFVFLYGGWNLVFFILLTGIIGLRIFKIQGFYTLARIQEKLGRGENPQSEVFSGILLSIAGLLLMAPGVLSDIMGMILIFPWTRKLVARRLGPRMIYQFTPAPPPKEPNTIKDVNSPPF